MIKNSIHPGETNPKIFSLIRSSSEGFSIPDSNDALTHRISQRSEKNREGEREREIDAHVNQVLFTNPSRNLNQTRFAPKVRRADGDNGDEKTRGGEGRMRAGKHAANGREMQIAMIDRIREPRSIAAHCYPWKCACNMGDAIQ